MLLLKRIVGAFAGLMLSLLIFICMIPALLDGLSIVLQKQSHRLLCWSLNTHHYDLLIAFTLQDLKDARCSRCSTLISDSDLLILEQQLKLLAEYLKAIHNMTNPDTMELEKLR